MPIKTAMILAAGRGERLKPLTDSRPKPLIEVAGQSMIEHHINHLVESGVQRIVINTAWLGDQIENFIGHGDKWDIEIRYSREGDSPLETAGGIANALPLIDSDSFILVNGDICTDYDFTLLPNRLDRPAHVVLVPNPSHNLDGDFGIKNSLLVNKDSDCAKTMTFSGISCFNSHVFKHIQPKKAALGPLLRALTKQQKVTAEAHLTRWIDVGTSSRLELARKIFAT